MLRLPLRRGARCVVSYSTVVSLCIVVGGLVAAPIPAAAATTTAADPVRLIPPSADLVLQIRNPRALADLAVRFGTRPELQGFRGYRDYLDSTNYQLFRQLVAHLEHVLGHSWPELLDEAAGGGIAIAIKVQKTAPPPIYVVIQGRDPALTAKIFQTLLSVARQERLRQGLPTGYEKQEYRGVETWKLDDQLFAAVLGDAIVYSNLALGLQAAVDQHLDSSKPSLLRESAYADAQEFVPDDVLASVWVKLDFVHNSPELKPLLALPSSFFPPQLLFGGLIDAIKRSPYLVVALRKESDGFAITVRLPRGTHGMHEFNQIHVPPAGTPAALPLLEPEGLLYTASSYLDFPLLWKHRSLLLPTDQLKGLNDFEEKSSAVLYGKRLSWFFEHFGVRQRFVVARQQETGYRTTPRTQLPAFAVVLEMPDAKEFAKTVDGPLRTLAFVGQLQYGMTPIDESHAAAQVVGYRFVENDANKARDDGYLFNFSPCRAQLNDQFIVSSTKELTERLIDEIGKQSLEKIGRDPSVTHQSKFAWQGLSNYLGGIRKQLVTQNVLEQGNNPADAAKEVALFLSMLDHLGRIEMTNRYEREQYRIDFKFSAN